MSTKTGHWNIDIREGDGNLRRPQRMTQQTRVQADDARTAIAQGIKEYFVYMRQRAFDLAGGKSPLQPLKTVPKLTLHKDKKGDDFVTFPAEHRGEVIVATAIPVQQGPDGQWQRRKPKKTAAKKKTAKKTAKKKPAQSRSDS